MSGFPIRTPWDHSSVDSSPRPIAASHVLHRLLVPRHPPFALDNLNKHKPRTNKTYVLQTFWLTNHRKQDARVHYTILNPQPTHNPHQKHAARHRRRYTSGIVLGTEKTPTTPTREPARLFLQDSTGCHTPTTSRTTVPFPPTLRREPAVLGKHCGRCRCLTRQCLRHLSTPPPHPGSAGSLPTFAGRCSLERR